MFVIAAREDYSRPFVDLHRSSDRRWIAEPQVAYPEAFLTKEETACLVERARMADQ